MSSWFPYAIVAALLYGLHQVFTKLAANRIAAGPGGLILEATATVTILIYVVLLQFGGERNLLFSRSGTLWSAVAGLCVGAGTIAFYLLFQRGGPLSAVPGILAGGLALVALVGFLGFHEQLSVTRLAGIVLSVAGLWLLSR